MDAAIIVGHDEYELRVERIGKLLTIGIWSGEHENFYGNAGPLAEVTLYKERQIRGLHQWLGQIIKDIEAEPREEKE